MTQYILEGEWTGYTSDQQRVVHREICSAQEYKRLSHLHAIRYTDGTSLILFFREKRPKERVIGNNLYGSLIRDAARKGTAIVLVSDLCVRAPNETRATP